MNTVETIHEKVHRLPLEAQKEVLEAVEQIEKRYLKNGGSTENDKKVEHPLALLGKIKIDFPHSDLAERHDFYAHGKLEED